MTVTVEVITVYISAFPLMISKIILDLIYGKPLKTDESETVFKCLRCDVTDDDSDQMREHIDKLHGKDKASKCNLCDYEDESWIGLILHFKSKHMKKT